MMKKIFKIILISSVSILVIVFLGVFIFLKAFDFNRFKPQLTAAAQSALGRPVNFSKVSLNLTFSGIQLRLNDLSVGENTDFGNGNFLVVKEADLSLSLVELIFKRQIQILGIEVKSPQVTIIKLKDGRINAQSFGAPATALPVNTGMQTTNLVNKPGKKPGIALPAILINYINIDNASIDYIDYSFSPEILVTIKKVSLNLNKFSFQTSSDGLVTLKGQCALTKGSLRMKELAVPIDVIEGKLTLSESVITLNKLLLSFGKGKMDFSGELKDYMSSQNYSANFKVNGVDLGECLDQSVYPVKANGLVFAQLELKGQGFDFVTALTKLSAKGSAEIRDGRLVDINVLRIVLDKLAIVPNLAEALETKLPDRYKESLRAKDTVLSACNATLEVSDGSAAIKSINVDTDAFKFQGNGILGFDQRYSFNGAFTISRDLSALMIEAVPEMEYLQDKERQVRFPLKVSGKGAEVSFMPDIKDLGMTAIMNKGRQELEKVLDKVMGDKGSSGQQEESGSSDQKAGKQELIDSVIGTVFGEK